MAVGEQQRAACQRVLQAGDGVLVCHLPELMAYVLGVFEEGRGCGQHLGNHRPEGVAAAVGGDDGLRLPLERRHEVDLASHHDRIDVLVWNHHPMSRRMQRDGGDETDDRPLTFTAPIEIEPRQRVLHEHARTTPVPELRSYAIGTAIRRCNVGDVHGEHRAHHPWQWCHRLAPGPRRHVRLRQPVGEPPATERSYGQGWPWKGPLGRHRRILGCPRTTR
jgi:hypothetical protein